MKDLMITAYSGFSTVSGETNLTTVITNIRNGAYFHTVRKVEQQLRLGDLSKANAIKKQLPFFTLTGNYSALRQPYSLLRYNPVITVDVDDDGDSFVASIDAPATAEGSVSYVSKLSEAEGNKDGQYAKLDDGNKYTYSKYTASDLDDINMEHPTLDVNYRLYLDPNGYVLGFKLAGESETKVVKKVVRKKAE